MIRYALLLALLLSACAPDRLVNPNSPTPASVGSSPLQALQLGATGVVASQRNSMPAYLIATGQFGREMFDVVPTESRSVTAYYENFSDPTSGASGDWTDRYATLRNIAAFATTVAAATTVPAAQRSAALGFAETLQGLELSYLAATRNNLGIVVQILPSATALAPFVSRDSAWTFVSAVLDSGYAALTAAGNVAFPFSLPEAAGQGWSGFDTPATFATFNRALKARVEAYRASLAGNNTAGYQRVLTALHGSFLTPLVADGSNLGLGPSYLFGNQGTDVANTVSATFQPIYAHPSIRDDGTVSATDKRYLAKILAGQALQTPSGANVTTDLRLQVYATATSPIPIVTNEELVLLRAEAEWFTGDANGALADINAVRTVSGGLSSRAAFTGTQDFVTELLAQRRLSLLFQGHRWIDVRRFGRLAALPLSGSTFGLTSNQVIPQAECLARQDAGSASLACPAFTAQ